MREVLELLASKRATVVTSALVFSEVLNRAQDAERVRDKLNQLLLRPGFAVIDATLAVSNKAGEVREHVNASGVQLKRNDAIYIATALLFKVDALHTFDPGLCGLDGSPLVDGLRIHHPRGQQMTLALGQAP